MKKFFALAPLALALVLMGCDDVQVSTGASWSVSNISSRYVYYNGGFVFRRMHSRQRYWRDYNRHNYGGRPGWNPRPDWAGNHLVAPPQGLTKDDLAAYARIGQAFGVSTRAATVVMEALNRAAVGDFGGLADLGLTGAKLAAAQKNGGRLEAKDLDRLSRVLGVSRQKADAMIQIVVARR